MNTFDQDQLANHLRQNKLIIDVRSPGEFVQGALPGSINLPILNDSERHDVGLCYKTDGQAAAILLGHQIVSGATLETRCSQWAELVIRDPQTILTCFRGGLRSQSAQKFLHDKGTKVRRLDGGYKAARTQLLEVIQHFSQPLVILTGSTGSGKTHVLNSISLFYPAIDLEGLAHHRGSAFGAWDIAQPSQADFENRFAVKLLQIKPADTHVPLLLEDESRMIGHRHIPEVFFTKMRESAVVLLIEPIENRIENIFVDYISTKLNAQSTNEGVTSVLAAYKNSVQKIKNKLGGARAQELLLDMDACETEFINHRSLAKNRIWIEKLLVWYYDPMYQGSLEKRNPQITFRGASEAVKDYFSAQKL